MGNVTVNTDPRPGSLSAAIVPEKSSSIIFFIVARPIPIPFDASFVVKNGSNTRARTAGVMPHPLSRTQNVTSPDRSPIVTPMVRARVSLRGRFSYDSMAFKSRLITIS
jgi:hypothetical protein